MKRLCMRSPVRVACLAALLTLGCAALSFADPDPTGGGFQGVPDALQTRMQTPDDGSAGKKHYCPPPTSNKKNGGSLLSTSSMRDGNLLNLLIRTWQTQIRFMIQH